MMSSEYVDTPLVGERKRDRCVKRLCSLLYIVTLLGISFTVAILSLATLTGYGEKFVNTVCEDNLLKCNVKEFGVEALRKCSNAECIALYINEEKQKNGCPLIDEFCGPVVYGFLNNQWTKTHRLSYNRKIIKILRGEDIYDSDGNTKDSNYFFVIIFVFGLFFVFTIIGGLIKRNARRNNTL